MNADLKTGGPVVLLRIQKNTTSFKRHLINSRDPQAAALISRPFRALLEARPDPFYSSAWREGHSLLQLQRPVYLFHSVRVLLLLLNAIRNYISGVWYIQGFFLTPPRTPISTRGRRFNGQIVFTSLAPLNTTTDGESDKKSITIPLSTCPQRS